MTGAKTSKSFASNTEYYDTTVVLGRSLPRTISPTDWARQHGLAHSDIADIRLVDVCWRGWQEWSLRTLAAGVPTHVVFTRSAKESVFISRLLSWIRHQKIDIDQCLSNAYQEQMGRFPTQDMLTKDAPKCMDMLINKLAPTFPSLAGHGGDSSGSAMPANSKRQVEEPRSPPPSKKARARSPSKDEPSPPEAWTLSPQKRTLHDVCLPSKNKARKWKELTKLSKKEERQVEATIEQLDAYYKTWLCHGDCLYSMLPNLPTTRSLVWWPWLRTVCADCTDKYACVRRRQT